MAKPTQLGLTRRNFWNEVGIASMLGAQEMTKATLRDIIRSALIAYIDGGETTELVDGEFDDLKRYVGESILLDGAELWFENRNGRLFLVDAPPAGAVGRE